MAGHRFGLRRGDSSAGCLTCVAATLGLALLIIGAAFAQDPGDYPNTLPNTTITSDNNGGAADVGGAPAGESAQPAKRTHPARRTHFIRHPRKPERPYRSAVEPTRAMLKLKQDAWVYAHPEVSSHRLERVHTGKFVDVTGSTHYYVQVRLKRGATGYVPISAVELTRRQDKILRLSTDAGVISQPNRYGKRLAEVHQGHDVHVIGTALNYLKIQMKSGLEGFIPMTAVE